MESFAGPSAPAPETTKNKKARSVSMGPGSFAFETPFKVDSGNRRKVRPAEL
jgi:hypothetical protein